MRCGYAWGEIEDAVLAVLQAEMGEQANTLDHYQGDWRRDLSRKTWRLPAVLVRLEEGRAGQVGWGAYEVTLDLTVLVITQQLRGEAHNRRGKGGAYDLVQAVKQALWHRDLGLEILPLALAEERPLLNTAEHTVYGLRFRTGWLCEAASD